MPPHSPPPSQTHARLTTPHPCRASCRCVRAPRRRPLRKPPSLFHCPPHRAHRRGPTPQAGAARRHERQGARRRARSLAARRLQLQLPPQAPGASRKRCGFCGVGGWMGGETSRVVEGNANGRPRCMDPSPQSLGAYCMYFFLLHAPRPCILFLTHSHPKSSLSSPVIAPQVTRPKACS
jgi:hypothetical protein